jgi:hypothetical protein
MSLLMKIEDSETKGIKQFKVKLFNVTPTLRNVAIAHVYVKGYLYVNYAAVKVALNKLK